MITSIESLKETAEALLRERESFAEMMAEEPNDRNTDQFIIVEVSMGEDHFGETVWTEVFRHHSRGWVGSYLALYHAGRTARITLVRRHFRGHDSGEIVKTLVKEVPDGFDGIQSHERRAGW